MADNQPSNPTEEEKAFWDKFENTLNSWWDAKQKTDPPKTDPPKTDSPKDPPKTDPPAEPAKGTSRTGGKRVTLPGLIADIVFGPPKD